MSLLEHDPDGVAVTETVAIAPACHPRAHRAAPHLAGSPGAWPPPTPGPGRSITASVETTARRRSAGVAALGALALLISSLAVVDELVRGGQYRQTLGPGGIAVQLLLVTCIAGLIAELTRRRRTAEASCRREEALQLLYGVSMATTGALTDRFAMHLALQAVCSYLDASAGIVYLTDEHGRAAVSTSLWDGADPALAERFARQGDEVLTGDGIIRRAVVERRLTWSAEGKPPAERDGRSPIRIAVPITVGDEVAGVLEVLLATGDAFRPSTDVEQALLAVGTQLGRVVERARHHEQTARRSEELAEANRQIEAARAVEQQRRVDAERSSLEKSDFLAKMNHELRTPLNAVLGFAQLLEEERLPKQQAEFVACISRSGRHLLDLVNGLLDISRIEAGHPDLELREVAVADLVAEATGMLSTQGKSRDVRLITALPADLCVTADPQRLFQVVLNLVSNAIKFNRHGGEVEITARQLASGAVRLVVEDTGPGIPEELLPRLFRPFDRLGAKEVGGTGLGLALTRQLVEAMGGTIGVSSAVGNGSRFWIDLPASDRAPTPESPHDPESGRPRRGGTSWSTLPHVPGYDSHIQGRPGGRPWRALGEVE